MNGLDIFLALPLLYALYRGFRSGILVQLAGIVGLLLGVYLAAHYGSEAGVALFPEKSWATAVGFLCVGVVTLIALVLLGRLLRTLVRFASLGSFDRVGGALFGLLKMALLLSAILMAFTLLNKSTQWMEPSYFEQSLLYYPVERIGAVVFPYWSMLTQQLMVL